MKSLFRFVACALVAAPVLAADFGEDLAFLKSHTPVVLLSDPSGAAQVAVVPAWQGRVMTSTAGGLKGTSYGWVNRELIASGEVRQHFNPLGGEDRFWLGPEGGQFSVFFSKGAPFDLAHWYTPAAVDTEGYTIVSQASDRVVYRHAIDVTNYSGTRLQVEVTRDVRLLNAADALAAHHLMLPAGVSAVAFESVNTIKNTGATAWSPDTGLLSIWILGMFNASPAATVVVPFAPGSEAALGPKVNDTYFGKVPADRLVVRDHVAFFRGDSNYRSKIGFPPRRAPSLLGSYDAVSRTLTLISFTRPAGATDYVNSMWEIQAHPFAGDVVNSYNDGPPAAGAKQLGHFFELESSSPALALAPGASATHTHQTIHLQGDETKLDAVARAALGVSLAEITGAFGH
jgi:hypothetical protein